MTWVVTKKTLFGPVVAGCFDRYSGGLAKAAVRRSNPARNKRYSLPIHGLERFVGVGRRSLLASCGAPSATWRGLIAPANNLPSFSKVGEGVKERGIGDLH
jgi:hypothetical protein